MVARRSSGRRTTAAADRPHVPTPSEEEVKKGAPSMRVSYIKEGVPVYRHRDGKNRIRFLAWKDGVHFFYYLYVHRGIGVNQDSWACLQKNWNEPDPICEDAQKQLDEGVEWDDVLNQGILPGQNPRILCQIVDRENEAAGVQVWDVTAHKTDNAIRSLSIHDDTGAIIPWTDPDEGCDLIYDYDSKGQYPTPDSLRRSDKCPIDPEFYRDIMDFDEDVIYKPTYEEMAESHFGEAGAEDKEDKPAEKEETPSEEIPKDEEQQQIPDEDDPLEGKDCFGKAYGFYGEDCSKDKCVDFEACGKEKKWTGDNCPECGLPTFDTSSGAVCALGHGGDVERKEEKAVSRRRRR